MAPGGIPYVDQICDELNPVCGNPGACCDDATGICTTEFELACVGRFIAGATCDPDPFDPPCGEYVAPCASQPPNQVTGIFADIACAACPTGIQLLAENFVLGSERNVTGVRVWGGYYPGNIPLDNDLFIVKIYADDAGGVPGTELAVYGPTAATTRDTTGVVLFGVDEYVYTIDLAETLGPGTYWIAVYNDTATLATDSWFWEAGDLDVTAGIAGQAFTFADPPDTWNYDAATDMAFELICE